jgi:hypothetical protein
MEDTAMKTDQMIPKTVALSAALFLIQARASAQTWATVLDYQLAAGQFAQGSALAANTAGDVFCGGTAADGAGGLADAAHGLVLKTDTSAANWFLSDDPTPSPSQYSSRVWRGLGFDSQGNLYSVGSLTPKGSSAPYPSYWLVRKSSDGGVSWSTEDAFQYSPGLASEGRSFAADASGGIYAAGYVSSPATKRTDPAPLHWLVRKSTDAGQTWSVVDDYYNKAGYPKWGIPQKADFVPGVGLFVVGQTAANANGYSQTWTVRRSTDGGATWSTVDLYQPGGAGYISCANSLTSDSQANIYIVGRADISQVIKSKTYTVGQYIVRKSSDGGSTWANIDVFSVGPGKIASAVAVGIDAAGKPVVAGQYQDANTVYHWIVRRPDAIGNWQTVDDFQLVSGYEAGPQDLVSDTAGNLVITGFADDSAGSHWVVRRLANSTP